VVTGDPAYPSLDFIFEQVTASRASLTAQADALDTKAGLVLGSASFLTAGAASLQGTLASKAAAHAVFGIHLSAIVPLLTFVTVCIYLFAVFAAWQGYRTRTYSVTPAPDRLLAYLTVRDEETKLAIIDALVDVYLPQDRPMLISKVRWTRWAPSALLAEAV
jgi:hypothetical protein